MTVDEAFNDKVALVTGAASGIGRVICACVFPRGRVRAAGQTRHAALAYRQLKEFANEVGGDTPRESAGSTACPNRADHCRCDDRTEESRC